MNNINLGSLFDKTKPLNKPKNYFAANDLTNYCWKKLQAVSYGFIKSKQFIINEEMSLISDTISDFSLCTFYIKCTRSEILDVSRFAPFLPCHVDKVLF